MDREPVLQARAGDEAAFEDLIAARLDRLYAAAGLILHDPVLAEDAVQETMLRAWRDLPALRDPDRFAGWLHRVLVHACLDLARRNRHARSEVELGVDTDATAIGDPAMAIADHEALDRAFDSLSPEHRAVIVLRHYLGHSVPEVAEALGLRLGTAKSRLSRAEAALRRALERDGEVAPQRGAA